MRLALLVAACFALLTSPLCADTVSVKDGGGVYFAPARLPVADFVGLMLVDSGASYASVSGNALAMQALEGKLTPPVPIYTSLADGSTGVVYVFKVTGFHVGNCLIPGTVEIAQSAGPFDTLGMSVLKRIEPWHFDSGRHEFDFTCPKK